MTFVAGEKLTEEEAVKKYFALKKLVEIFTFGDDTIIKIKPADIYFVLIINDTLHLSANNYTPVTATPLIVAA